DEACAVVFVAGAAAVGAVFAQKVAQGVGGVGGDDASGVDGRFDQTGDDMALRPKRVFYIFPRFMDKKTTQVQRSIPRWIFAPIDSFYYEHKPTCHQ
ncbi:MAG: hypothetical protein ACOYYI_11035, partial [Chloroflexota bacterium]